MKGEQLISQLAQATGLPLSWVKNEIYKLIEKKGGEVENINLAQLRVILAEFLQDVLLEAHTHEPP